VSVENVSSQPAAKPRGSILWPWMIIALLGLHATLVVVTVVTATRDPSFAVEPNYYQKSLHWDATAQQARDNVRLGWTLNLEIKGVAGASGERTVACTLVDREGRPLDGAHIDLVAFAFARGRDRLSAVLTPQGDGVYEAAARVAVKGKWEFRFVVSRGPETFTCTLHREV
jgi:nitrogen fixation protein FixH